MFGLNPPTPFKFKRYYKHRPLYRPMSPLQKVPGTGSLYPGRPPNIRKKVKTMIPNQIYSESLEMKTFYNTKVGSLNGVFSSRSSIMLKRL